MFAWGLRHVNVYTVAAGGEGRRQGPKRQLTLTRVDVTKVYYKIHNFERYALRPPSLFISVSDPDLDSGDLLDPDSESGSRSRVLKRFQILNHNKIILLVKHFILKFTSFDEKL